METNKFRITGKITNYVVCKLCNSKGVQLNKAFGAWPTSDFKSLSDKDKTDFYKMAKDITHVKNLKEYYSAFLEKSRPAGWSLKLQFESCCSALEVAEHHGQNSSRDHTAPGSARKAHARMAKISH